jgi:hypothetical protein
MGKRKGEIICRSLRRYRIPVLQDGDFTIAESPAILCYLAETYGNANNVALLPAVSRARAQWLEWSFFISPRQQPFPVGSSLIMRFHRCWISGASRSTKCGRPRVGSFLHVCSIGRDAAHVTAGPNLGNGFGPN